MKQTDEHVFYLPVAKKLGGKLDVVSYHDEVEGGFLIKVNTDLCVLLNTKSMIQYVYNNLWVCVCFCVAEGKPPGAPSGISVSEIDRTYVVLSWKAPAYFSSAPMWYYIEKVTNTVFPPPLSLKILHCTQYLCILSVV